MGLGDLISKVLVEVKGDTSDLKAKLKDLQGVEKERTKALIDGIEQQNRGYDSAIKTLGHVGLALDTIGKAYDAAKDAMKTYGETLRLESATAGINIGKLNDAFGGLINQHDLMTLAAQTNSGVLKLNQGQMETLGQAAIALKNRGFDLEESLKKLTDAAVKGKVEGLDDLGLSIKSGASNAETLRNMMTELNKVIRESGTATNNEADAVKRLSVEWENATTKAKGYAAQAIMAAGAALNFDEMARQGWMSKSNGVNAFNQGINSGRDQVRYGQGMHNFATGLNKGRQTVIDSQTVEMPDMDLSGDKATRAKSADDAAKKRAEALRKLANDWEKKVTDDLVLKIEGDIRGGNTSSAGINPNDWAINTDTTYKNAAAQADDEDKQKAKDKKKRRIEMVLGPISEFDEYQAGLETLGKSFDAFGAAVSASYEAIVTGQGSASAAFKKVMADGLMAMGKSSVVEALRETALGFGSLALGPLGGASATMHFKAAALHAAVAVAAGAAAHSIGTSAQASAADKAADAKAKEEEKAKTEADKKRKGGSSSGGDGTEHRGNVYYIAYGDVFAEDSPRNRRQKAEQTIRKVLGGDSGTDS